MRSPQNNAKSLFKSSSSSAFMINKTHMQEATYPHMLGPRGDQITEMFG